MQMLMKIMKFAKIKYRLLVYFTSVTLCSGDIKKRSEKSSFFAPSPTLNLNENPANQLIKNSGLMYKVHIWPYMRSEWPK